MSDPFESSWQKRWAGLAERLELALENNASRLVLCLATAALILIYAGVGARMAEPARWARSPFIEIHESVRLEFRDTDAVNRSIVRLDRLASVLGLNPQRLVLLTTKEEVARPFAFETRALRLWLDEYRGFGPEGMYDLTSDAIARAIIVISFPNERLTADLPNPNSNWFGHVRTMKETCVEIKSNASSVTSQFAREWGAVCGVLRPSKEPNPLSLSKWLTSQMVAESRTLSVGRRVYYLRSLVRLSASPELAKFERAGSWPNSPQAFGPIAKEIVSKLAPKRAQQISFKAYVPFLLLDLESRDQSDAREVLESGDSPEISADLLVLTSCKLPLLSQFDRLVAREVVWARKCEPSSTFVAASSAVEFAEKNPNAVFAQVGIREIETALSRGWLGRDLDIAEFIVESRNLHSVVVAAQLRAQTEMWNPQAQAFRVKAPVEVLKLVRLRSI